jgi:hypothetical protein
MINKFPRTTSRRRRGDEDRIGSMMFNMDDNRKEVRRENKQVRKLKKLRSLESKGKTGTNRYTKLKEKVYNPFPENTNSRRKAIKEFKKGYEKVGKVKSGEYDREKREFYYSKENKRVELLPSDDADRPITKGVKKRNLGKNFK